MRMRHFLGVSWLLLGRLAALGLLALALPLTGCGGGGDDGGGLPPSTAGPNAGNGFLLIVNPTSGAYQTDQLTVTLGGNSFTPAGASCVPFAVLPPAYQVTWSNNSTGATGDASRGLSCVLLVFVFWDATNIPLAMGANSITATAIDGAGNVGRDAIVATRLPDTTPPTVVSAWPVGTASPVGRSTFVTVTFSEAMDQSTISATTVSLEDDANNLVAASVTYDSFSLSATLFPSSLLASNTTYQATVTTGVRDASGGNALAAPYTFFFRTGLFF